MATVKRGDIAAAPSAGYFCTVTRVSSRSAPRYRSRSTPASSDKALSAATRQVRGATGQLLPIPREYAALFDAAAAKAGHTPIKLRRPASASAIAAGSLASGSVVQMWISCCRGRSLGGTSSEKEGNTPTPRAGRCADNGVVSCRREQMVIDDTLANASCRWIVGGDGRTC
jgi:hypothetical protein